MRTIQVYFHDGDRLTTSINGTDEEIAAHYLGKQFEAGSDTKHHVAILVKFLDTGTTRGLYLKNIESGWMGEVQDVRMDGDDLFAKCVKIYRIGPNVCREDDDTAEYDLSDCWVYSPTFRWINTIGYRKETA